MSENRIDMLLNGSSDRTTSSSVASATQHGTALQAGTTPDPYTVPSGAQATSGQVPSDSDAQVFVDGHEVAAGDDGLNVDVMADGSSKVTHSESGDSGSDGGGGNGTDSHGHPNDAGGQQGGEHPWSDQAQNTGGSSNDNVAVGTPETGHGRSPSDAGHGQQPQHVKGDGANAAQADISEHGFGKNAPHVFTTKNADGSLDILIRKGPHNPHDIRVHVDPGKHVTIDVSPGKHGDVKVKVDKAKPGDGKSDGGQGAGAKDGKDGQGKDKDGLPKTPSGGGGSPSGGGGSPSGGGGGTPTGGYPRTGNPPGRSDGGQRNGDPEAIKKLGDDIDRQAGGTMDSAHEKASAINVSYPAFGVLGFPLNMAHNSVRDSAANYVKQGRTMLTNWQQTLGTNAKTWQQGEDASTVTNQ
ncbi:hypothetical protein NE236_15300 [Actinoallomurus purpureus]|uniref:hypothetical protein n=1 Tax=Actinoallomurus purpureus TaxID=478114 RepID=UPI00209317C0|nr:hypothetical protein [Actinoallomurus purpureus]MCO6006356.1 hypothetical protein [Actinoallomurus purpureus]